ncbi:MAG: hypothetical protein OEW75_08875, partial [Cyclobacteriaceae bacterium]|nr:hypothetical protein [Cyclobacteriaceae bacterium]
MFKKVNISTKITGLVTLMVLGTVFAISYISFNVNRSTILERYNENLELIALNRATYIQSYFNNILNTIKFIQVSGISETNPYRNNDEEALTEPDTPSVNFDISEYLENIKTQYNFKNLYLLSSDGEVLYGTEEKEKFQIFDASFLSKSLEDVYFSLLQQSSQSIYAGGPIRHRNGQRTILAIELDGTYLLNYISDTNGLGETGECLIARQIGEWIQYQIPFRGDTLLSDRIPFDSTSNAKPIKEALLGNTG